MVAHGMKKISKFDLKKPEMVKQTLLTPNYHIKNQRH
jgi:hypothetical protein